MENAKDLAFMEKALELARQAFDQDEVPVGALLVKGDQIISTSGNQRETSQNPLHHAEAQVIAQASNVLQSWRLLDTTLYVTMEPCLMCTGLIFAARIPRVVFGCKNPKGGSLLYIQDRKSELCLNHTVEIQGGALEMYSAKLLKDFFQRKRLKS